MTAEANRLVPALWAAVSAVSAVLAIAASVHFGVDVPGNPYARLAAIPAAVVIAILGLVARLPARTAIGSALAAGGFAVLGSLVVMHYGWDAVRAGLVPNLCDHPVPVMLWVALIAAFAGAIALLTALTTRLVVMSIAVAAFAAPLAVWWSQSAVAYGCG